MIVLGRVAYLTRLWVGFRQVSCEPTKYLRHNLNQDELECLVRIVHSASEVEAEREAVIAALINIADASYLDLENIQWTKEPIEMTTQERWQRGAIN